MNYLFKDNMNNKNNFFNEHSDETNEIEQRRRW